MDIKLRQLQREAHTKQDEASKEEFVHSLLKSGVQPSGLQELSWVANYYKQEKEKVEQANKKFFYQNLTPFLVSLFRENPEFKWFFTVRHSYDEYGRAEEAWTVPVWKSITDFPDRFVRFHKRIFPDNALPAEISEIIDLFVYNTSAEPYIWAYRENNTLFIAYFESFASARRVKGLAPAVEEMIEELEDTDIDPFKFSTEIVTKFGGTCETFEL